MGCSFSIDLIHGVYHIVESIRIRVRKEYVVIWFDGRFHVEMEDSFQAFFALAVIYLARHSLPLLTIEGQISFYQFEVVLMAYLEISWCMAVGQKFGLVAHVLEMKSQSLWLEYIALILFVESLFGLRDPRNSKKEASSPRGCIRDVGPTIRAKPHLESVISLIFFIDFIENLSLCLPGPTSCSRSSDTFG